MAATFYVGTSGWHYYHWLGAFYPEDLPPSRWLAHYARRFATVELNNPFYRQPRAAAWDLWRRTAPEGFVFAVKANRFLTHIKRLKDVEEPLRRFLEGATRLGPHLGPILYQLPPSFHRTVENEERLARFLAILPRGLRHAIEFRHRSWLTDDTCRLLGEHGVALCCFDAPRLRTPLVATAPFAYMRFHGAEALYASNYSDEELAQWARRLAALGEGLEAVYVYFNNDACAFAVFNALALMEHLQALGQDVATPSASA
ncbi:MAG: DUF72 domain-containing protein [Dehalococcoidia bacterium]|jgi:uncharacterized protein YecE (DUF72 family)|nr:DUF72 domain-containing protein [Dehalococcoidia bacterium]MDW8008526.1 DUF72 domain-containing protein [Chloroflexota bacterium]